MTHALTPLQAFWRLYRFHFYATGSLTLVLLLLLVVNLWASLPLITRGIEVQGVSTVETYVSRTCQSDDCAGGARRGQVYYVVNRRIEFTTLTGDSVTLHRTGNQRNQPQRGSQAPAALIYLPEAPQEASRGTRASLTRGITLLYWAVPLALLVLLGQAAHAAFMVRRAFALAERGKARRARVNSDTGPRAVHWTLSDGRKGHSLPLTPGAPVPRTGARITVLDDGKHGVWAAQIAPARDEGVA